MYQLSWMNSEIGDAAWPSSVQGVYCQFFFFSGWKIFKANHIASNVQNWKDKQHFVSDYKIKQTVKIYIACEWKNWNYR